MVFGSAAYFYVSNRTSPMGAGSAMAAGLLTVLGGTLAWVALVRLHTPLATDFLHGCVWWPFGGGYLSSPEPLVGLLVIPAGAVLVGAFLGLTHFLITHSRSGSVSTFLGAVIITAVLLALHLSASQSLRGGGSSYVLYCVTEVVRTERRPSVLTPERMDAAVRRQHEARSAEESSAWLRERTTEDSARTSSDGSTSE
jgi:hypothetical protein